MEVNVGGSGPQGTSASTRQDDYGVLLISTETLLELKLATARSGNPSRLKSPTATDTGVLAARKLRAARNLPSPLPKSTDTSVEPPPATTKSSHPSPLKSPTARSE